MVAAVVVIVVVAVVVDAVVDAVVADAVAVDAVVVVVVVVVVAKIIYCVSTMYEIVVYQYHTHLMASSGMILFLHIHRRIHHLTRYTLLSFHTLVYSSGLALHSHLHTPRGGPTNQQL